MKGKKQMNNQREAVIQTLLDTKILVILRGYTRDQLLRIGEAVHAGGVGQMEVTFDQRKIIPDAETAGYVEALCAAFRGGMHIGAGTVMTEEQVRIAREAGAEFIVSPDTYAPVIAETRRLEMVSIPGVFTATEAAMAHRYGADFVKLFPGGALGAKYLKDLATPLSHIRFLAVGGITLDNIAEYEAAGALGYGISSGIVKKQWVLDGDYAAITAQTKRYFEAMAAQR